MNRHEKIQLLVPMAGAGSRFKDAGYKRPKPLIKFNGKYMFQHVVDAISTNNHFYSINFIIQKQDSKEFNIDQIIHNLYSDKNVNIYFLDGVTDGAARSIKLASDILEEKLPTAVINCDNILETKKPITFNNDEIGKIYTFECPEKDPKWSYVKLNNNVVIEVAEKTPISTHATAGLYVWKSTKLMQESIDIMIRSNKRVNNEFYLAPAFNETIAINTGHISIEPIKRMVGVGTPEELEKALKDDQI